MTRLSRADTFLDRWRALSRCSADAAQALTAVNSPQWRTPVMVLLLAALQLPFLSTVA